MSNSFNIFGFTITYYALCILLGVVVAYLVIRKLAKKHNITIGKAELINKIVKSNFSLRFCKYHPDFLLKFHNRSNNSK